MIFQGVKKKWSGHEKLTDEQTDGWVDGRHDTIRYGLIRISQNDPPYPSYLEENPSWYVQIEHVEVSQFSH